MTRATALKKIQAQQISRLPETAALKKNHLPPPEDMPKSAVPEPAAPVQADAGPSKPKAQPAAVQAKDGRAAKKPKMLKRSLRLSDTEEDSLDGMKEACRKAGFRIRKGELLRLGLSMLRQIDPADMREMLQALPSKKRGLQGKA